MIVLALGIKGSGKTRLLRQLTARRLITHPQSWALVHDPFAQWQGGQEFATCRDVLQAARSGRLPRLCLVRQDTASAVCSTALEIGQVTLVIDELDQVCKAKTWDGGKDGAPYHVAHYGRHRGVDLFGAFRFTRNVNEDLPSLADYTFLLRHSSAALYDLRTLGQRYGETATQKVTRLQNHQAIVWHDG